MREVAVEMFLMLMAAVAEVSLSFSTGCVSRSPVPWQSLGCRPQDSVGTWVHSSLALAPLSHHSANSLTSLSWVSGASGSVPMLVGIAAASGAPSLQPPWVPLSSVTILCGERRPRSAPGWPHAHRQLEQDHSSAWPWQDPGRSAGGGEEELPPEGSPPWGSRDPKTALRSDFLHSPATFLSGKETGIP